MYEEAKGARLTLEAYSLKVKCVLTYFKKLSISKSIYHSMHVALASEIQSCSNMTMGGFHTLQIAIDTSIAGY